MEKGELKKYEYNILIWTFMAIPLVDFINGAIINVLNNDNGISFGKIYRIITMLILIFITLKNSNKVERIKHFKVFSITCIVISIYLFIFYLYHGTVKGIIVDAVWISKFLLIILIIYAMYFLFRKRLISTSLVECIFDGICLIMPITMIIPYTIGIGNVAYTGGFGYTGLYYANNDLSIVLLLTTTFAIDKLIKKLSITNLIILISNTVSLLLVGSKTGIMGLILVIALYLFYNIKLSVKNKKISKRKITILIVSLVVILAIVCYLFLPLFDKMINRFIYFYNKEGNIFAAIFSGREKFLVENINTLLNEKFMIIKLLFGVGFYYREIWPAREIIEMDMFDISFSLGIIVAIVVVYCLAKLLYNMFKCLNTNNFKYFISLIMIITFSTLAGHVAFSAFAGSMLALIIVGTIMTTSQASDKKEENKKIKVLIVGSDSSVKGGITTVINQYLNYNFKSIEVEQLSTYIEGSALEKILFFIKNYYKYMKKAILKDFDIAHIHMSYKGSFYRKLLIALTARINNRKYIIHLHGSEFKVFYDNSNKIVKMLIRILLKNCDCFIVLGENWRKIIIDIEPKTNIYILKNSISIPDYKVEISNDKFNILFLGVLIKRKGIYDLIEAIRILKKDDIIKTYNLTFNIGGVGKEENNIKSLIKSYNIESCINMIGWIDGSKKEELLKKSNLFVLPSYNEGLPMAILEAMSYGIPAISTQVGSIGELILNDENGYLIDVNNPEKLSECIINIIKDKNKWNKFSVNAKEKIKSEFDEKLYFEKVEILYNELYKN